MIYFVASILVLIIIQNQSGLRQQSEEKEWEILVARKIGRGQGQNGREEEGEKGEGGKEEKK